MNNKFEQLAEYSRPHLNEQCQQLINNQQPLGFNVWQALLYRSTLVPIHFVPTYEQARIRETFTPSA